MNERIRELAEHCDFYVGNEHHDKSHEEQQRLWVEKFAELIVRECIEQGKKVQSQTVSNASNDYNEGRKMGIEVFMNQIKKHFGVE